MTRWQYCEVVWQPVQVMITYPRADAEPIVEAYASDEWYAHLARLGAEGWEMVNCTGSPMGAHEYYFYFKRPLH